MLSLICRAWAKVRAKQIRTWLEEHIELLVGRRQEAEFQAAVLATSEPGQGNGRGGRRLFQGL